MKTPEFAALIERRADVQGFVRRALTPREQAVVCARWGLPPCDCEHTYKEIGGVLGVTGERVRQIEAKALRKLRRMRTWQVGGTTR